MKVRHFKNWKETIMWESVTIYSGYMVGAHTSDYKREGEELVYERHESELRTDFKFYDSEDR